MSSTTTVIVGTSVGGVRTAQALRSAGYAGAIVLVGEEPTWPYDKPPLSKGLLHGGQQLEDVLLLGQDEADAADIRLVLGRRAVRLDVPHSRVELDDGQRLPFDDVVIATGAKARPSPWGTPSGVHVLRTADDATALGADLRRGGPVVVVGGGFIGAEVASAARTLGLEVTVVDPVPIPMSRVLSPDVAEHFIKMHQRHGVQTRLGVGVAGIEGEQGALQVTLINGEVLQAATVVVGIGADPNDDWLLSSGLLIDNGVVCDEHCRTVDAPRVHAVGDVARWYHPSHGEHVRVEHWTNAVEQASVVAHNIVHPDDLHSHAPVEYVWSDQHDWKIQVAGRTGGPREHVLLGDPDSDGPFAALYTEDGEQLSGAVTVNWPRAILACRRALASRGPLAQVRDGLLSQRSSPRAAPVARPVQGTLTKAP